MKRIIRLTESDLARIVKRVIKEEYHENIETPSDDDWRSKLDSYKRKMENFLRELKSSGTEIDKHRFLKQVQKETDQMYWDVYDNSDSEPEGFVELQMDLIKHFRKKLNESYRSRVIKEDSESLEREARIILNRLGYSMLLLKDYTRKELAKTLRQENENRFSSRDKWERLADKLDD